MKLFWISLLPALAGMAWAQVIIASSGPVGGMPANVSGAVISAPNIAGAPFSANVLSESSRALANGDHTHQVSARKIYRDAQGRTRSESGLTADSSSGSAQNPGAYPQRIMIMDPVEHRMIILDPQKKTAIIHPWPVSRAASPFTSATSMNGPQTLTPAGKPTLPTAVLQPNSALTLSSSASSTATVKSEKLETKELQGVLVTGTRTIRTTAAGTLGNAEPIVATTDTWFSPELKVVVLSETNDPQFGSSTTKLTDLERVEPDPSLFQVPSDYTVQDNTKHP